MSDLPQSSVMVTGATGFVGRYVIRELLSRGLTPVCLVRDANKLHAQHRDVSPNRLTPIIGDITDRKSIRQAAALSQAAIHLVGIIIARPLRGQTFRRIHAQGTQNVVDMVRSCGIRRYVHMSALGTRPDAIARYHQTKWTAEEHVRGSGLDWTIFRPSLIHGPDGEFMRLMRKFMCDLLPPVIPYFGSGQARVQPVYVKDVAHCFVEAILRNETIGKVVPLGGPRAYSWVEMYNACRAHMRCSRPWKRLVSLPAPVAKAAAVLNTPLLAAGEALMPSLGMLRFDSGQVQMAQEDSICDHTIAEQAFGIQMRDFEAELRRYADLIE